MNREVWVLAALCVCSVGTLCVCALCVRSVRCCITASLHYCIIDLPSSRVALVDADLMIHKAAVEEEEEDVVDRAEAVAAEVSGLHNALNVITARWQRLYHTPSQHLSTFFQPVVNGRIDLGTGVCGLEPAFQPVVKL